MNASKTREWTIIITVLLLSISGCSSNENSHTTATTVVTPPRRQVLTIFQLQAKGDGNSATAVDLNRPGIDANKPLLIVDSPESKTYRADEVVVIDFRVLNAKLTDDGGEYRIRYFVDDDDPRWIIKDGPVGMSGWIPGKHTIRLELIGPDGWPYRNGDQNIVTREITVT